MTTALLMVLLLGPVPISGMQEEPSIPPITSAGWGPIRIPMPVDQAAASLHSSFEEWPGQESRPEFENCRYVTSAGAPGLLFMVWRKHPLFHGDPRWHIVRIDTRDSRYATRSGVRVGDTEATARRVYAGRFIEDAHPHVATGFRLTIPGRVGGVVLQIPEGAVTEIQAGWKAGAAEGCT